MISKTAERIQHIRQVAPAECLSRNTWHPRLDCACVTSHLFLLSAVLSKTPSKDIVIVSSRFHHVSGRTVSEDRHSREECAHY